MFTFLQQLSRTGTQHAKKKTYLENRIMLANNIGLAIAFLVGLPFIGISLLFFPPLWPIPVAGTLISLAILPLNHLGLYNASRLVVAWGPALLACAYNAGLAMEGQPPFYGIMLVQLSFSFVPFLVFDLKEKGYLWPTVAGLVIALLGYKVWNSWLEIPLDTEIIRSGWLSTVSAFLGVYIGMTFVYLLLLQNKKAEQRAAQLLQETTASNAALATAKEETEKNLLRLEEARQNEAKRQWVNEGLNEVANLVRRHQNINDFVQHIMPFLVKYMEANQGALFQVNQQQEQIEMLAAYAYGRKKHLQKTLAFGEGLVGQACLEKDVLHLTEIPQDYVTITSGLGQALPTAILIVPLLNEDEVAGVVEMAGFKPFEEQQIEFMQKLGEVVAAHLRNARANAKMQELLETSQEQTETMRSQEEEMRQNMEELQATQEQMKRKETDHLYQINRLEQMHEHNTERYRMLALVADHTDNSVIITDPQGLTEYVNKGFTKLTGYSLEEIQGKKPGALLQGPDTDPATVKRIRAKLNARLPFYEEILNYDTQGNEYWISMSVNPVFTEGQLTNFVSVQANITEMKQKALDHQAQVSAIDKNLATIEFDLQGNIQDANTNFLQAMGYTLPEIKGKHHRMFVRKEELGPEYEQMWETLRQGNILSEEVQRIGKSGQSVWLKAHYTPILDITDKPYKIIKYAQDVTHDKALAQNYQAQMEAIRRNYAVIEFDLEGNITDANPIFLDLMQYHKADIVGQHHRIFVFEEDQDAAYAQMWKDLAKGKSQAATFRRRKKNGQEVMLNSIYTPILNANGQTYKVVKYGQLATYATVNQEA